MGGPLPPAIAEFEQPIAFRRQRQPSQRRRGPAKTLGAQSSQMYKHDQGREPDGERERHGGAEDRRRRKGGERAERADDHAIGLELNENGR